jgi:hypothetical protein
MRVCLVPAAAILSAGLLYSLCLLYTGLARGFYPQMLRVVPRFLSRLYNTRSGIDPFQPPPRGTSVLLPGTGRPAKTPSAMSPVNPTFGTIGKVDLILSMKWRLFEASISILVTFNVLQFILCVALGQFSVLRSRI